VCDVGCGKTGEEVGGRKYVIGRDEAGLPPIGFRATLLDY